MLPTYGRQNRVRIVPDLMMSCWVNESIQNGIYKVSCKAGKFELIPANNFELIMLKTSF